MSLCRFLPRLTRTAFEEELSSLGITAVSPSHTADAMERSVTCKIASVLSCFFAQRFGIENVKCYLRVFQ